MSKTNEVFTLMKEFRFEAAHQLPNHDGKCQRLHGHSWLMRVVVSGDRLHVDGPKQGMLMDFSSISEVVKPYVEGYLDHHYLNETTGLKNPTSEELARWLYGILKEKIPSLIAIEINETCTSACRYERL